MRTQAALYVFLVFHQAVMSMAVVTIAEDSSKGLMRREKEQREMKEDFVEFTNPTPVPENTCNDDFPLGNNNSNTCKNTTHHRLILDEGMCIRAAKLSNAGIEIDFFPLGQDYQELHPQGCFAWHCSQTENRTGTNYSTCYYYNGNGDSPSDPKGEPVCFRADYLNGTKDTNGGCDPGYQNVMDETTCREAAECLGFSKETEFRVGEWNWTKHKEYPKGCFIRTDTGSFQFNNVSSISGDPPNPEIGGGIPVCNVSNTTNWAN